eukprot:TRINITY_DN66561_c0_g1_i1.p1 TRINITY_DN66561_c0_g1~~TRINITY_DN66561_c0_g1_i1.p1  ORF type:complete len:169 (-),score=47.12 TRINITY_DN66561_c0_g1_i1:8-514(-)
MSGTSYEICIKSREQNIMVLRVMETDTISEVLAKLKDKLGESVQQSLFFNGVELTDKEATLLEYNIVADDCPGGPVLNLGGSPWSDFDLECKLPNGSLLKECVTQETTVAQLKGRITSEAGIPYLCMKLFAQGSELRDALTLAHYKLPGQCRVEVVTTRPLYAGPAAA